MEDVAIGMVPKSTSLTRLIGEAKLDGGLEWVSNYNSVKVPTRFQASTVTLNV